MNKSPAQNLTWDSPDGGEGLVRAILDTYFSARDEGMDVETVARKAFGVSLQKKSALSFARVSTMQGHGVPLEDFNFRNCRTAPKPL